MTTAPSSGLSPEAKEFVPLVQNPTTSIPLYVDENTVASIYPSDQQPLMVQSIYPMILTNSKVTDNIQFPEIEFHIQPSQQQQFHIDSSTNIQQQPSTNGNAPSNNTSQIVLLPITNPTNTVTLTGYYPDSHVIYSTNEQVSAYYPIDYCEQPLINFSLQQPTSITKSNRILSQQQRPTSFRQHYGINHSIHRPSSRGGNRGSGHINNNNSRNPYYEYPNRRNGSSYMQNSGRGNTSNSKRISSSYHSNDHNNYYHGSRPRGYAPRSSNQYDERRKDHYHDYYNHDNDSQHLSNVNDDGIPFEFRPEDFPSLPMNHQQPDKSSSPVNAVASSSKPTSSWNAIVSASRRRSTSPQSIPQSQDQRSDRSRSFNNKPPSKIEQKSSLKKPLLKTSVTTKSINSASKTRSEDDQQCLNVNNSSINDNEDDGFIQTKQQHRRLKRKNKNKEELTAFNEPANDSAPYILDDENTFPTLGQNQMSELLTNEHDSNQAQIENKSNQISLTDMFNSLSTSANIKQENSHNPSVTTIVNNSTNSFDSKPTKERKSRKLTKLKCSISKELEDNQSQRQISLSELPNEKKELDEKNIQNETDTNITNVNETDHQNSNPLSSSSNNSSDTSDYDDAVDNFDDE